MSSEFVATAWQHQWPAKGLLAECRRLAAERDKALNQARHWEEQEAKQRRLHHEQGHWKHRALAAELAAAAHMKDGRDRWTEQEIREAYDHGSTAGVCEDVDDIISALHYRFHGWSEPCCSSADDGTTP